MVRADITYKRKHISLGSFENDELAGLAREEAALALGRRGLIPDRTLRPGSIMLADSGHLPEITDYSLCTALPFEKWVTLINFRDNSIYIHNPIYLRRDYFEYYLNEDLVFKFSLDDLFYYSEHKIMKRGNHLFVADYGMQTSVMSRFGVHNYSVPGRDYVFINNDPTDLRYSNIEIINHYIGVFKEEKKNKSVYVAKIHINGSVIIGRYSDEITAAIAYNKAADTLTRAGGKRHYELNYIDSISDDEYRKIYKSLVIHVSLKG